MSRSEIALLVFFAGATLAACGGGGTMPITNIGGGRGAPSPLPLTISACVAGSCASQAPPPNGAVGARYGYLIWCTDPLSGLCNYGVILQASGGLAPYTTWSLTGQPPGLSLGCFWNLTGCYAPDVREISGAPTSAGTYKVIATVTDSESPPKQARVNYSITVTP
jgi:hypothetical protein